jgi:hypothetical protein
MPLSGQCFEQKKVSGEEINTIGTFMSGQHSAVSKYITVLQAYKMNMCPDRKSCWMPHKIDYII